MTIEAATFISQLNSANPGAGDPRSEGDDHLRLLKSTLKATFPNFGAAAMNATTAELNYSVGVTSLIQPQLNAISSAVAAFVGYAPLASPSFTGNVNVSGYLVSQTALYARNMAVSGDGVNGYLNPQLAGSKLFLAADNYTVLEVAHAGQGVKVNNDLLIVGDYTTQAAGIEIGKNLQGNRPAYLDLQGDLTYTDFGMRLIREGNGPNSNSLMLHRGLGALILDAFDAGSIEMYTNNARRGFVGSDGWLNWQYPLIVNAGSANVSNTLTVQNTGALGAGILLIGNGTVTPKKFIRVLDGVFEIINSAYSAPIVSITDGGTLTTPGPHYAPQYVATSGVAYRMKENAGQSGIATLLYSDSVSFYFLLTNSGDANGAFNALRPLSIVKSTGLVAMGQGLTVDGGFTLATGNAVINGALNIGSYLGVTGGLVVGGGITVSSGVSLTSGSLSISAGNFTVAGGAFLNGGVTVTLGSTFNAKVTVTPSTGATVMADSTGNRGTVEVQNGAVGPAMMTFHRTGQHAFYFGIDNDNKLKRGGWSLGSVSYEMVDTGNAQSLGLANMPVSVTAATSFTAVRFNAYDLTAAVTATLPASPAVGDWVTFTDVTGNASAANHLIGRNAQNIMGLAQDMTFNVSNATVTLQFIGGSKGWQIK